MVQKRKLGISVEHVLHQEGSQNPTTPPVLTPAEVKHFRRQFSQHNFGTSTKKNIRCLSYERITHYKKI